MKVEIKNWMGVVVLLCLGLILGRLTTFPAVNATPQESEIGRYQMVVGEIEDIKVTADYTQDTNKADIRNRVVPRRTLFRLDTATGEVEVYQRTWVSIYTDRIEVDHDWVPITGTRSSPNR